MWTALLQEIARNLSGLPGNLFMEVGFKDKSSQANKVNFFRMCDFLL